MLLQVKIEDIVEGLRKAANVIPTKSGAAYLRSLWIRAEDDTLTFMSTDTNLEFTGTYSAKVFEPGMVGVNGKQFVDLMNKMKGGEVRLKLDENSSTFTVEKGPKIKYSMPISDVTWFQQLEPFPIEHAVMWSGDFLQEAINKTLFCVSDEEFSDALSCLYIRPSHGDGWNIDICGLNGHQFAVIHITHDELAEALPENGILIQKKYVNDLLRWLSDGDIELNVTDKRLFVRSSGGAECLSFPRSGYVYPDYSVFLARLQSPDASTLTLRRKECKDALERLLLFNTDNERYASFELTGTELSLSAASQDTGRGFETLEVLYDGSLKKIVFPTKIMIDILDRYDSETLDLTLTTAEGPCGISGGSDPGYTVLLMPMKVAEQDYYEEEA